MFMPLTEDPPIVLVRPKLCSLLLSSLTNSFYIHSPQQMRIIREGWRIVCLHQTQQLVSVRGNMQEFQCRSHRFLPLQACVGVQGLLRRPRGGVHTG